MQEVKALAEIWPLFAGLIGVVVWLVRLEGRVNYIDAAQKDLHADVAELRVKHESLDSKVVEQLSQVRESLARIEGALGVRNGERL